MSLFTSTQIINDGSADQTFLYRYQVPSNAAVIGEYVNSADPSALITPKHEISNSKTQRSVLRYTLDAVINAESGETAPITVNTSVAYNKKHATADVEKALTLSNKAMAVPGVTARFVSRFI